MADLTNSEIKSILKSHGRECGPITPQTRSVYLTLIKKLQDGNITNKKGTRRSEPINTRMDSHESIVSCDSGLSLIANDYRKKEMTGRIVSPISYSSRTVAKESHQYSEPPQIKTTQTNDSNSGNKWYKGSMRTISSYLGPKDNGLLDISDGDLSDTEGTLITRLRRNYFKKSSTREVPASPHSTHNTGKKYRSIDCSQLPNILLLLFFVLIVVVFGSYLTFKNRYSHVELDLALERLECRDLNWSDCIEKKDILSLKPYLQRLYSMLSEHAGKSLCQQSDGTRLPFQKAKEYLNYGLRQSKEMEISDLDWNNLMKLVISLPTKQLNIVAYNNEEEVLDETRIPEEVTFLECLKPKLPLSCRLKLASITIFNWLSYIVLAVLIIAVVLLVMYGLYLYRRRQKEAADRRDAELQDILTNISDILQEQLRHSESNSNIEAFMSLEKIRRILQQSYPRLRENPLWEKVKEYAFRHEPCIHLRDNINQGPILQWRGRPGWQGSAVHSGKEVSFEKGPTECLKVRNMVVDGSLPDWEQYLHRELQARLRDVGEIRHTAFVRKESKVIAYIMCASREVAGRAFKNINANYFDGNLLNVKFIRLDKYVDRFPSAREFLK